MLDDNDGGSGGDDDEQLKPFLSSNHRKYESKNDTISIDSSTFVSPATENEFLSKSKSLLPSLMMDRLMDSRRFRSMKSMNRLFSAFHFNCTGKSEGYYADVEFGCRIFHYCKRNVVKYTFTCPGTSIFNQKELACENFDRNLDLNHLVSNHSLRRKRSCDDSERYYFINSLLYNSTMPSISISLPLTKFTSTEETPRARSDEDQNQNRTIELFRRKIDKLIEKHENLPKPLETSSDQNESDEIRNSKNRLKIIDLNDLGYLKKILRSNNANNGGDADRFDESSQNHHHDHLLNEDEDDDGDGDDEENNKQSNNPNRYQLYEETTKAPFSKPIWFNSNPNSFSSSSAFVPSYHPLMFLDRNQSIDSNSQKSGNQNFYTGQNNSIGLPLQINQTTDSSRENPYQVTAVRQQHQLEVSSTKSAPKFDQKDQERTNEKRLNRNHNLIMMLMAMNRDDNHHLNHPHRFDSNGMLQLQRQILKQYRQQKQQQQYEKLMEQLFDGSSISESNLLQQYSQMFPTLIPIPVQNRSWTDQNRSESRTRNRSDPVTLLNSFRKKLLRNWNLDNLANVAKIIANSFPNNQDDNDLATSSSSSIKNIHKSMRTIFDLNQNYFQNENDDGDGNENDLDHVDNRYTSFDKYLNGDYFNRINHNIEPLSSSASNWMHFYKRLLFRKPLEYSNRISNKFLDRFRSFWASKI